MCGGRYEDPGDAAAGHAAHAWECPPPLLLRLLHLWYCWRTAVGGDAASALLHRPAQECHCCS